MRSYRIGRADTNDIVLADSTVSREHAELAEVGGGRFRIKDLGSTFGLAIWHEQDWQKVTECELRHDTQLRIGEYQTTVAELLRDTDQTVVRAKAREPAEANPPEPPPVPAEAAAPAPPKPAPPRPPPSSRTAPTEAGPAQAKPAPPHPSAPAFQFLRNLPPEKRILVWLGAGFAAFLFVSFITLILTLVL
jgi:predicted component of type VI protein secretion system